MAPGLYGLPPDGVISISRRRLMAHDQAIRAATLLDANVQALVVQKSLERVAVKGISNETG
jgi:hypothetical protein